MQQLDMSEATRALLPLLDSLSPAEALSAAESATQHLRNELSLRYRVVQTAPRISKPKKAGETSRRTIVVLIVDYQKRRTLEVTTGPGGSVEQVDDLGEFQPPFVFEEIKEAREIAERTDCLRPLRKRAGIFVQPFAPERREEMGRRVGLRYRAPEEDGSVSVLLEAVVDLADRRLVRFEEICKPERRGM